MEQKDKALLSYLRQTERNLNNAYVHSVIRRKNTDVRDRLFQTEAIRNTDRLIQELEKKK